MHGMTLDRRAPLVTKALRAFAPPRPGEDFVWKRSAGRPEDGACLLQCTSTRFHSGSRRADSVRVALEGGAAGSSRIALQCVPRHHRGADQGARRSLGTEAPCAEIQQCTSAAGSNWSFGPEFQERGPAPVRHVLAIPVTRRELRETLAGRLQGGGTKAMSIGSPVLGFQLKTARTSATEPAAQRLTVVIVVPSSPRKTDDAGHAGAV